jgi:hypothetical protein
MAKIPGLNSSIADFWGRRGANPEILATTKLSGTLFEVIDEWEVIDLSRLYQRVSQAFTREDMVHDPAGSTTEKKKVSPRKLTPSQIAETVQGEDLLT